MLIKITADGPVEQYDLYIRDDATAELIFHSGFNPVLAPGEKSADGTGTRDLTKDALKIAVKLSKGGKFTLLIVGVATGPGGGTTLFEGGKPALDARQLFWAAHVDIDGANEIDARLLTVPPGDDQDRDLWPDATDFPAHVPEALALYGNKMDLLDCDDKIDDPAGPDGVVHMLGAKDINPFAVEICGDGYDENCNGTGDEACIDKDGDGDPRGSDCDDNAANRHHANALDPYPDPPNCCGYSLGKKGTPDEFKNFLGDPVLCPGMRCGDGIDESCRGSSQNDPANDTACVYDADCDGYPAPPNGNDCDDNDPTVHPGALEICGNNKNESCAASGPDSGCVPCDLDGDGFQRNDSAANCPDSTYPAGKMFDCNDYDAGVYPGAALVAGNKEGGINAQGRIATALKGLCRRIYEPTTLTGTAKIGVGGFAVGDADCDGTAFSGCPPVACDADGDGWPVDGCGALNLMGPFDCNDNDPTIFPGAPDKCGDGVDGSCAGMDTPCAGMDKDGDGYLPPSDCDDNNNAIHPFAVELCNGIDDDCDGDKDEGNPDPTGSPLVVGGAISQCTDDNDGECAKQKGTCVCSPTTPKSVQDMPAKRTLCSGELAASARTPHCFGAGQPHPQSCDAVDRDDDCNGTSSDLTGTNLLLKGQACGLTIGTCKQGTVTGCDRAQMTSPYFGTQATPDDVHWICGGAVGPVAEKCNGFDDDCEGTLPVGEQDPDMDKYMACAGCGGLTLAGTLMGCNDCDPAVGSTHPGAPELCDNVDNNCANGITDDGANDALCTGKSCCSAQAACRNLQNGDPANCGTCGNSCSVRAQAGAGQPADNCAAGGCVCGGGAACASNNWCNGGACALCNSVAHCGANCTPCVGGNVCKTDGTACTGCNNDADCDAKNAVGTTYCSGGACLARKALGAMCTPPGMPNNPDPECLGTAYCTDGVCCDKPSSMCGGCSACNRAASNGTCSLVQPGDANPDPHNLCTANLAGCTLATCNGVGSCYAGDGVACGAVSCVDNATESHTQVQECTGGSMCGATPTMLAACGDYKCNGAACYPSCAADSQCQSGKPFCHEVVKGGDGHCYAKRPASDVCAVNGDCDSGACVGGRCCGMGARPASCGAGTATTACAGSSLTTYACTAISNYTQCSSASAPCGGNLQCASLTACAGTCTCSGGAPCSNPAQGGDNSNCTAGNRCVNVGDTMCTSCTTLQFCGATCVACAPNCAGSTISGDVCTGGTMCAAMHACANNFACANMTTCATDCVDDTACAAARWCHKLAGTNSCDARIASGMACNDTNCQTTGCLQCQGGVPCPLGGGKSCP